MAMDIMYSLYSVLTLINIVFVLILLYYFVQTYREVKSKFSLGLAIFALVYLVNAILRCPAFYFLFTPEHSCPYNPYYTIAAGFEFVALVILIYLVRK
jgi:hypothetical protein